MIDLHLLGLMLGNRDGGPRTFLYLPCLMDSINRFYFTDVADSYAAAFHDESAMGVIAVPVYLEVQRRHARADLSRALPKSEQRVAPSARTEGESAGTGFGREEHSPARLVAFEPEGMPDPPREWSYEPFLDELPVPDPLIV